FEPIGDPTEVALLAAAIKGGIVPAELRRRHPRRAEIPFDAAAKMMATQHDGPSGSRAFLKGASNEVLELCRAAPHVSVEATLDDRARRAAMAAAERLAARSLRVLAVAVVEGTPVDGRAGFAGFRGRAVLLGLVGQIDPPRGEAKEAVAACREA